MDTEKALDLIPSLKSAIYRIEEAQEAVEGNREHGEHIAWLRRTDLEDRIDDALIIMNQIERALVGE